MKHQVRTTISLPFPGRSVLLDFKPCEIKTIKIPYDPAKEISEVNMLEIELGD
jgi:alpha-mannosidase